MFEQIYEWIRMISVCLVVMTALMHAVPGKDYGKYIRFFTGIVLIILLITPALKFFGMEQQFRTLWSGKEYEQNRREIEEAQELYEKFGLADVPVREIPGGNGTEEVRIEVGEITVGE